MAKVTANEEIKRYNRSSIYAALREHGPLSRQDLVRELQLSLPTVTQNLANLQDEGLIDGSGFLGNTGGRRAKTYSVVADARTAIGLDVTRNHITSVAVDLNGSVIARLRVRVPFSRTPAYYERLGQIVRTTVENAGLDERAILGVGIGVPGLITPDNQRVFYGKILNFTDATCEEFSQDIPFRSALFNDANAAGFAETWMNRDLDNAFYIMLSNNVGGAVYINRQPYVGENIRGGEVGHITIEPGGRPCYCGARGCVDAYCAATVLSALTDGNLAEFFALLKCGDQRAHALWDKYLHDLAQTVVDLRLLFDCNIILGGYVGGYIEDYLDDLKALAKTSFEDNADYLIPCRCKNEAIAVGAALHFISEFIESV